MSTPEGPALNRRQRQAAQTRREIVAAARRLFAAQGYSATSVAQVAAAAGVSVQTIYDSVGSKAALVRSLNDVIDEEAEIYPLLAELTESSDPADVIGVAARITQRIHERCADIVAVVAGAAPVGPELAAVLAEGRVRHRTGVRRLVAQVGERGQLRPGLNVDDAADIVAALTDSNVAVTFTEEYGWTWDRWREWTQAALVDLVLAPPARSRR